MAERREQALHAAQTEQTSKDTPDAHPKMPQAAVGKMAIPNATHPGALELTLQLGFGGYSKAKALEKMLNETTGTELSRDQEEAGGSFSLSLPIRLAFQLCGLRPCCCHTRHPKARSHTACLPALPCPFFNSIRIQQHPAKSEQQVAVTRKRQAQYCRVPCPMSHGDTCPPDTLWVPPLLPTPAPTSSCTLGGKGGRGKTGCIHAKPNSNVRVCFQENGPEGPCLPRPP